MESIKEIKKRLASITFELWPDNDKGSRFCYPVPRATQYRATMRCTPNLKRKREKKTKVFVSLVYLVIYHLCLLMSIGCLVTCGWAETLRWQVKTIGLFSVSATYSLPSFRFALNFEVVSVSKWRRVFVLFFPTNLSDITALLKVRHTFLLCFFFRSFLVRSRWLL